MSDEHPATETVKDVPAPSEAGAGVKAVGATCPQDGTFVTCVGTQEDAQLVGQCAYCGQRVFARSDVIHSIGSLESAVVSGKK